MTREELNHGAQTIATSGFTGVNKVGELSVNGDKCETLTEVSVAHRSGNKKFNDELMCEVELGGRQITVVVTAPCRRVSANVVEVHKNAELKAFVPGKPTDSGRVQPMEIYQAEELAKITVGSLLGLRAICPI